MGSLILPDLKQQFIDMLDDTHLAIISQFMVWLDEKVSEFKVNGYMKLDNGPDRAPRWIEEYTSLHDSATESSSVCTAHIDSKADMNNDADSVTNTPEVLPTPNQHPITILTRMTSPVKASSNITPVKKFVSRTFFPSSVSTSGISKPMKLRITKVDSDTFDTGPVISPEPDNSAQESNEKLNGISAIEPEVMKSDLSTATPIHTIEVCIDENGEYYIVNTDGKVSEETLTEGVIHYDDDDDDDNVDEDAKVVLEHEAGSDVTMTVEGEKIYQSGRRREWVQRVKKTPKEYECRYCNKKFVTPYKMRRHEGIHTGEKPYECTICQKTFIVEGYLHEHMKLHTDQRPCQCLYCHKSFKIKGQLTTHIRVVHEGLKPFACSFCDHRCYSATMLREHMNIHTRDRPHKCDICDKTFSFKTNLSKHLKNHQGIRPHQCPECGKSFTDKCLLVKHQERMHSDSATQKRLTLMSSCDRPHRCLMCGMGFKLKYGLTKHMQIHSSSRPFKCDYCPRAYRRNYDLSLHMNIHTNFKNYMCSVCGKCYTQSQSLRAHVKTVHGDDIYKEQYTGAGGKLDILTDEIQPLEN